MSGLSLFGAAYAASLIAGSIIISNGDRGSEAYAPLLVPLAGPFISIGTTEHPTLMTLNAVVQTGGLLLTVIGAVWTDKVLVRKQMYKPLALSAPRRLD